MARAIFVLATIVLVATSRPAVAAMFPGHINLVDKQTPVGPADVPHWIFVVHFAAPPAPPTATLDFTGCPGLALDDPQPDPTLVVNCPMHTVTAPVVPVASVGDFEAVFTIVGATPAGVSPRSPSVALLSVGTLPLGPVRVSTYDLDAAGGLNLADLSIWANAYFSGIFAARCDYNADGVLTLADLSVWAAAYGSGLDIVSPVGCLVP